MKKIEMLPPIIVNGVPIPRKVAYVEDLGGGGGCGCLLAIGILILLAAVIWMVT